MRADILQTLQKLSKERHEADIKDFIFIEVPKGKLIKPKRYYTKREDAEKIFAEKEERIKAIAAKIESKLK